MKKLATLLPVLLLMGFIFPQTALADGIIIPEPPPCDPCPPLPSPMNQLVIRYHHVTVQIDNQVAVTRVDQVFANPNDWAVEGSYIFPLPQDASVSGFSLWVDGRPVAGKILEADQAREQYNEIVRTLRDPALLEYAGQGAFQAHVFPIPAQGERRVELEYSQVLGSDEGLIRYIYPLNTEKFSAEPLENVSISLDIFSNMPIRAVYSPSHPVDVHRDDESHVRIGYEDQHVLPDSDFALYYSLGESEAIHLLSYRDPGSEDADGHFLLLLAPGVEEPEQVSKDVILVLDQSGSMEGEKFRQAQDALRYVLKHLDPDDRFQIIAFSTGLETYTPDLQSASGASEALAWVDRLSAAGSTDINRALLEAASMVDKERPAYLIFLTDGLPTEGVEDSEQILNNLREAAPDNLRLFPFGVGYDVDTYLLDRLAQTHHGSSTYVVPGERIDEVLSSFYDRISVPVMTDISLDFGDVTTYDLFPDPLPDLFHGSQIIALGRYRQGGQTTITLTGEVNGEIRKNRFEKQSFEIDSHPDRPGVDSALTAIPRLWATRKVGHLLQQIRLGEPDEETIDQIVRLSIRYGIVTPYTSYLVTEEKPLGETQLAQIVRDQYAQIESAPAAPSSGQKAVQEAADQGSLAEAEAVIPSAIEVQEQVVTVGSRTFVLSEGIWIDTAFDPQEMETHQLAFLSDEYFEMVSKNAALADAFALGQRVIAIDNGIAYEVVLQQSDSGPGIGRTEGPTPSPAVNLPLVNNPEEPEPTEAPTSDSASAPPLPCLGGMLVVIAVPVTLLTRLRNGLRDRVQ